MRTSSNVITIADGINLIAQAQLDTAQRDDKRKRQQRLRDKHNQRIIEKLANGETV